jgi:hypothetical protein
MDGTERHPLGASAAVTIGSRQKCERRDVRQKRQDLTDAPDIAPITKAERLTPRTRRKAIAVAIDSSAPPIPSIG